MRELNPRYHVKNSNLSLPALFIRVPQLKLCVPFYSIVTLESFKLFLLLVASLWFICVRITVIVIIVTISMYSLARIDLITTVQIPGCCSEL
jgi:hypothetical protein